MALECLKSVLYVDIPPNDVFILVCVGFSLAFGAVVAAWAYLYENVPDIKVDLGPGAI